jgi:Domain of unknown function (DUF2610)
MKSIRIFVSSPGDVGAERVKAQEIFDRLNTEFSGHLHLEPYFWEHEPMRASADFQTQIMQEAAPSQFDIFICLLWARLGSRLHPALHQKADGAAFASGTESEILDALAGYQQCHAPELYIYKRDSAPLIPSEPVEKARQALDQKEALDQFWEGISRDQGHFIMGYNGYKDLEDFEIKFEVGMRKVLQQHLPEGVTGEYHVARSWVEDSPFRGLQVFEFEHAPIFFGRTKAIDEVISALRQQAQKKSAFLLIYGASGSGKSSLARAGVMPFLVKPGVVDGIGVWRSASMKPADAGTGDLFDLLALTLLKPEALPELASDGTTTEQLAEMLRTYPEGVGMLIKGALSQVSREIQLQENLEHQPKALFALLIDQMEELFTLGKIEEQREQFLLALRALSQSGYVWVLATLRSDFFARCAESETLLELTRDQGQYHLGVPREAELGQMIRLPAAAAGLLFQQDTVTGERLDDMLLHEAVRYPGTLPLLQFALNELYKNRDPEKNLLLLESFAAMNGVTGAVAQKAEETYAGLNLEAQQALDGVLRQLVLLGQGDEEVAARRVVLEEDIVRLPGAWELVNAFVQARLLTTDQDSSGRNTIAVAHEALLKVWPRALDWVAENHQYLRQRNRLEEAYRNWVDHGRHHDYLLNGLPLSEAENLLAKYTLTVQPEELTYITNSRAGTQKAERRRWMIALSVLAVTSVLAVISIIAAIYAQKQSKEATLQKEEAERQLHRADEGFKTTWQGLRNLYDSYGVTELSNASGMSINQSDILKNQFRENLLTQLYKLHEEQPDHVDTIHFITELTIENIRYKFYYGDYAGALGLIKKAKPWAATGADQTQLDAELYSLVLLQEARTFSSLPDNDKTKEVTESALSTINNYSSKWPDSWKLKLNITRLKNILYLQMHDQTKFPSLAMDCLRLINPSNIDFDVINSAVLISGNAYSDNLPQKPEAYAFIYNTLSLYDSYISLPDSKVSLSQLEILADDLNTFLNTLQKAPMDASDQDVVAKRKQILVVLEHAVGEMEAKLPRSPIVYNLRGKLIELERTAVAAGINTLPADQIEQASEAHKAGEALMGLGDETSSKILILVMLYSDSSSDAAAKQAILDSMQRILSDFDRLDLDSVNQLLHNGSLPTVIDQLRASATKGNEEDPFLQIYDKMIDRYIYLYSHTDETHRNGSIVQFSSLTDDKIQGWHASGKDREIIDFYDKCYADLPLEEDSIDYDDLSGLFRELNFSAEALYKSGKKSDAQRIWTQACTVGDAILAERPWDWYLHDSYMGLCFEGGGVLSKGGDKDEAQLLLRKAWTLQKEFVGATVDLNSYRELPIKGNMPESGPAQDMPFFSFYKPGEQDGWKEERFTVPCDFGGVKSPFYAYIIDGPNGYKTLEDQIRWLKEYRGGIFPTDVQESFKRLFDIASKNNVSYADLCIYAINGKDKKP